MAALLAALLCILACAWMVAIGHWVAAVLFAGAAAVWLVNAARERS